MGDTIRAQRVKYGMTEKQLAKKTGCAESFIKDVESGRRIPSDDVARRLLKAMGVTDAPGTELDAAAEPEMQPRPKPRPYIIPVPENEPAPTQKQQEAQQASNDAWLDALGGVVKRVPVIDEKGLAIDHVLFPIVGGKIEGGAPDKVLMYRCPDNALSGFRVFAGDLLLVVPEKNPVDDALIEQLLRAAMCAPTAMNSQPWSFVVVRDPAKIKALGDAMPATRCGNGAQAVIVVCGTLDNGLAQKEYWITDCSLASANILLAAKALGLGAIWTAGWPVAERVAHLRRILNIPATHMPLNVIPVGYAAENPPPKNKWKPERIHRDGWV